MKEKSKLTKEEKTKLAKSIQKSLLEAIYTNNTKVLNKNFDSRDKFHQSVIDKMCYLALSEPKKHTPVIELLKINGTNTLFSKYLSEEPELVNTAIKTDYRIFLKIDGGKDILVNALSKNHTLLKDAICIDAIHFNFRSSYETILKIKEVKNLFLKLLSKEPRSVIEFIKMDYRIFLRVEEGKDILIETLSGKSQLLKQIFLNKEIPAVAYKRYEDLSNIKGVNALIFKELLWDKQFREQVISDRDILLDLLYLVNKISGVKDSIIKTLLKPGSFGIKEDIRITNINTKSLKTLLDISRESPAIRKLIIKDFYLNKTDIAKEFNKFKLLIDYIIETPNLLYETFLNNRVLIDLADISEKSLSYVFSKFSNKEISKIINDNESLIKTLIKQFNKNYDLNNLDKVFRFANENALSKVSKTLLVKMKFSEPTNTLNKWSKIALYNNGIESLKDYNNSKTHELLKELLILNNFLTKGAYIILNNPKIYDDKAHINYAETAWTNVLREQFTKFSDIEVVNNHDDYELILQKAFKQYQVMNLNIEKYLDIAPKEVINIILSLSHRLNEKLMVQLSHLNETGQVVGDTLANALGIDVIIREEATEAISQENQLNNPYEYSIFSFELDIISFIALSFLSHSFAGLQND